MGIIEMTWDSDTFSQVEAKWWKCAIMWKQNGFSEILCLSIAVKCSQLNLKYLWAVTENIFTCIAFEAFSFETLSWIWN